MNKRTLGIAAPTVGGRRGTGGAALRRPPAASGMRVSTARRPRLPRPVWPGLARVSRPAHSVPHSPALVGWPRGKRRS